ncbi:hypothetical protein ACFYNZ_23870 [Streptomyces kebangsaanensis]|uniref:Serine/threonine protein kinase n=1 Tax=Streptomyces kebangsaanensis TaxID=864058 RepID=A0ABW6KX54_9ACTN
MAPSTDDFDHTLSPAGSPRARDRGLRRARRLTRWIAVTAVAGAAALGSLYTHLLPGGTAAPAPLSPPAQNPSASSSATAGGDEEHGERNSHEDGEDQHGAAAPAAPQPPAQPPAATQQQPHTTTGAS